MPEIILPNKWTPRAYQMPLWSYLEGGGKRAVAVWHRRSGKDSLGLNWTAGASMERVGTYWHMLPEAAQARKAIWDGVDRQGRRMIDQAFPVEIRKRTIDHEMKLELISGSFWQVVGSDNYNSLVGANPVGIVMSEYSIADPAAWNFLRPILAENGGWALFIYTSRGNNHGKKLHDIAKQNPHWFCEVLTVDDTGVLGPEVIEEERASGMDEDLIQQEYYCSFNSTIVGSYYGHLIASAEAQGRIGEVPYDRAHPVHTAWDLGRSDSTVIWFYQKIGRSIHVIDYFENAGEDIAYYAAILGQKMYNYGLHVAPHDAAAKNILSNYSAEDVMKNLGYPMWVLPREGIQEGINAVRMLLPRMYFDKVNTARGVECLKGYKKQWNDKMKTFMNTPQHDWASHAADGMRTLAMGFYEEEASAPPEYGDMPGAGGWMAG